MLKKLCLLSSCFLFAATSRAQTIPAAHGGHSASVGAEISTFNPDYGCDNSSPFACWNRQALGIAPFVDLDNLFFQRVGIEGEARFMPWRGPGNGFAEYNYLLGPRIGLLHFQNRFLLKGKFLLGDGKIAVPHHGAGDGNHFVYAPGCTAELRLTDRLSARADYEYQIWPGFKGTPTSTTTGTGGLTPNGFSFGVSYAWLARNPSSRVQAVLH